jgi:hypothetical protein
VLGLKQETDTIPASASVAVTQQTVVTYRIQPYLSKHWYRKSTWLGAMRPCCPAHFKTTNHTE